MRRTLTLASLIVGTAITTSAQQAVPAADSVLIPLSVGNSWTMELSAEETDEEVANAEVASPIDGARNEHSNSGLPHRLPYSVDEEVMIAGTPMYRLMGADEGPLVRNGPDGVYVWDEGSAVSRLFLKYPAVAGDSYLINAEGKDRARATVVAIDDKVIVGEAVLSCYHYRLEGPEDAARLDVWAAPGIGIAEIRLNMSTEVRTVGIVRGKLVSWNVRGKGGGERKGTVE